MCLQYIHEIPPELFSDLKQIGSGSFSTIFAATYKKTDIRVALKVSLNMIDNDDLNIVHQEMIVHKSLNHPLICKYYSDLETEHLTIIVMEFIDGLNLLEYVNKSRCLQAQEIKKIFAQIVIVVEYLHNEQNIAHRDLKLENIMVDSYGNIRLIDFGFSSPKRIMSTLCGSIPYCAPEVLKCENYTKKADIWCLGVMLYSLVYGKLPFYDTNMAKLANIICNNEPHYLPITDPLLLDLMKKLLIKDPCQRISIEDIKSHFFMSHVRILDIDYKKLFSPVHPQPMLFRRKSEARIKFSQSHPNIRNPPVIDNLNRSKKLSLHPISLQNNHSQIDELQKKVTMSHENIDELILYRRDYSRNLNLLIESASLIESHNFLNANDAGIRLEAAKPIHLNFSNIHIRRNSVHQSVLKQTPQIAKPI